MSYFKSHSVDATLTSLRMFVVHEGGKGREGLHVNGDQVDPKNVRSIERVRGATYRFVLRDGRCLVGRAEEDTIVFSGEREDGSTHPPFTLRDTHRLMVA